MEVQCNRFHSIIVFIGLKVLCGLLYIVEPMSWDHQILVYIIVTVAVHDDNDLSVRETVYVGLYASGGNELMKCRGLETSSESGACQLGTCACSEAVRDRRFQCMLSTAVSVLSPV